MLVAQCLLGTILLQFTIANLSKTQQQLMVVQWVLGAALLLLTIAITSPTQQILEEHCIHMLRAGT